MHELYDLVGRIAPRAKSQPRAWTRTGSHAHPFRERAGTARALTGREEAALEALRELATLETERRQLRRRDTQVRTLLERNIARCSDASRNASEADRLRRVTEKAV